MKKKKAPVALFVAIFLILAGVMFVQNLFRDKTIQLLVPNNAGVSLLETIDDSLVCVFKGGQVSSWDWTNLPQQKADFNVQTDRVVLLDAEHLVAVNKTGKKLLSVYSLPAGQKQKEFSVGWADQEVRPRISFDKSTVALIRKNPPDAAEKILYEFLTVDIEKELAGPPTVLTIQADSEDLVDYAADSNGVLYAVGSKEKTGRIVALDLENGTVLWDQTYEQAKEFCSIVISPDNEYLLAGNRDGMLYKLKAETGEIIKKIQLLEEGEMRQVFNDYSVLNLAFSADGQYYAATIIPKAYLLKTDSDTVIHSCTPANKLVSKIAFSPDNQFFATSDIRASYPIKIWPMPEGKR
jgi:outer membrane protein assembly factor BamB